MKDRTPDPARGFTLIEAMIVVAILALLAAIAYPSYVAQIQRGKRADARAVLLEAAQFMERFYATQSTYAGAVLPPRLATAPAGGSQPHHTITVSNLAPGSYLLTATPVGPDPCGALTLSHTGARDRLGTELSVAECWR
jgi:type IV pilus assembly protein PilE